jgi:hypothetical protein
LLAQSCCCGVEMPAYYRDTDAYGSWTDYPLPSRTSLLGAICAQCPMWALATVCPCAAQLVLRRAVLENDLARYACCQGYGYHTCLCCTPRQVQKCPSLCMYVEVSARVLHCVNGRCARARFVLRCCSRSSAASARMTVRRSTFTECLGFTGGRCSRDWTNLSSPQLC